MNKTCIIILHFGDLKTTQRCVQSILKNEKDFKSIVVVNNNEDEISEKDFSSKRVIVINNKKNVGFAAGVNIGIKRALVEKATHVYLLNNDTVVTQPTIPLLMKVLESQSHVGIVSPAIAFKKKNRQLFDVGGKINKFFGRTSHNEVKKITNKNYSSVTYVSGCAMLIKVEVIKKVGLFDDRFFLYYEDADFCLRAKNKNFDVYIQPSVSIEHALSKSVGKGSSFAVYHQTRSALLFGRKYFTKWYQKVANKAFILAQTIKIMLNNPKGSFGAWKAFAEQFPFIGFFSYFIILSFLSFANFWQLLSFIFWKDDWSLYWSTLYDLRGYHGYFNHPGTPIEFFLLSRILGLHFILWQSFGVMLRIADAFVVALSLGILTKSKKTGILAGIFFAVSYAGLESIHFISAQVTALAVIPLCLTVIYFLKAIRTNIKNLVWFLAWFMIAVLTDPPRVVPLILLFPFLIWLERESKNYGVFIRVFKKFYLGFFLVGVPLFIMWFVYLSPGTQLSIGIQQTLHDPSFILRKIYLWWNLAAAIGNLFIGLIYTMSQDYQNTGYYQRVFAIAGIALFVFSGICWGVYLKTKRKTIGLVSLLILWCFVFYLTNWFSEPRAPMAAPHRYLLISSVGFVGVISYIMSQIKYKIIFLMFLVAFLVLNIIKTQQILEFQKVYRQSDTAERIWNNINATVDMHHNQDMIWMFYGKDPWISQDILLNGSAPFAIKRQLRNSDVFPMMTSESKVAVQFLCKENLPQINRWNIVLQKTKIPLSHVYAWQVIDNGVLKDISKEKRNELNNLALKENCSPLN